MKKIVIFILILSLFATSMGAISIGEVANNLERPISIIRHLFFIGAYILGAGFLVSAVFRYFRFRQNPQEAPFSSVIVLFLIGFALIIVPLTYRLSHRLAITEGMQNVIKQDN